MRTNISYCDDDSIKELLMYRKITKVTNNTLYLDNGTELGIIPNMGCGGCNAGWYSVTELNGCDNMITNVEFMCDYLNGYDDNDDYNDYDDVLSYKIFVFAEDKKIKILQVDGSDGNGYYGTGYYINVKLK